MALDFNLLKDSENILVTYLKENNPTLDVSRGTGLRETVIKLAASALTYFREEARVAKESFSLKKTLEGLGSTSDVDPSIIDNLVSNWFVTRNLGSKATGWIRVDVDESKAYLVPSGQLFQIDGLNYFSIDQASIDPALTVGRSALYPTTEGTWYFLVPVTAADLGTEYNKKAGTAASVSGLDSSFLSASVYDDLTGGVSTETNAALIERAQTAITVRDMNTRRSIPFMIRQAFAYVSQVMVVGYGDPEMQRDVLEFPANVVINNAHFGGCIDIWVRTSEKPEFKIIEATVSPTGTVTIGSPDTPIYKIYSLISAANRVITEPLTYTWSTTGERNHRMLYPHNARFTEHEVLVISGLEAYADTQITIRCAKPPHIGELQAWTDAAENRVVACTSVIRAMCPVIVEMTVQYYSTTGALIDEAALGEAIASYINNIDPGNALTIAEIAAIIQRFEGVRALQLPLTVRASLETPDGLSEIFSNSVEITIPERPEVCLSPNTVAYFCDPTSGIKFSKLN